MSSTSFTQVMLNRYAKDIEKSTTHPFLVAAGTHELSRERLGEWLTQDKFYAFSGYPKFIASLILKLPLSTTYPSASPLDPKPTLALFSFALANVVRETSFFDSLGPMFNIDLSTPPPNSQGEGVEGMRLNGTTKAYVDFLQATASGGELDEGLVVLWGMEKLYLDAWTHAKSQTPSPSAEEPMKGSIPAALISLMDNWTCDEFIDFVKDCESAVERLALQEGSSEWSRCEEAFRYLVRLEQNFWPTL